jgi:hypothetical protein
VGFTAVVCWAPVRGQALGQAMWGMPRRIWMVRVSAYSWGGDRLPPDVYLITTEIQGLAGIIALRPWFIHEGSGAGEKL